MREKGGPGAARLVVAVEAAAVSLAMLLAILRAGGAGSARAFSGELLGRRGLQSLVSSARSLSVTLSDA